MQHEDSKRDCEVQADGILDLPGLTKPIPIRSCLHWCVHNSDTKINSVVAQSLRCPAVGCKGRVMVQAPSGPALA